MAARDNNSSVNISKLSHETGISRATVQNYLNYMRNARLLTLLYDEGDDMDCGKKPRKLYLHNPNLLNAVCLDNVDSSVIRKTFFLSQLCPTNRISDSLKSDFLVGGKHEINIRPEGTKHKHNTNVITMDDHIEQGQGNVIPLWLAGFIY